MQLRNKKGTKEEEAKKVILPFLPPNNYCHPKFVNQHGKNIFGKSGGFQFNI
jgi:hypothetical protein